MKRKITNRKLELELNKIDKTNIEDDYVASTVVLDDNGIPYHSGLLICSEEELYYLHYTGKNVELTEEIPESLYCIKMDIIHHKLTQAFLWHCEKLSHEVNPIYGFYFDESYYDSKGDYYLNNAKVDMTTCVGFCIKILTGFLEDRYLELNDWPTQDFSALPYSDSDSYINYLKNMAMCYSLDYNELFKDKKAIKRISPLELFTSSFYTELPIRKNDVDEIVNNVQKVLIKKSA